MITHWSMVSGKIKIYVSRSWWIIFCSRISHVFYFFVVRVACFINSYNSLRHILKNSGPNIFSTLSCGSVFKSSCHPDVVAAKHPQNPKDEGSLAVYLTTSHFAQGSQGSERVELFSHYFCLFSVKWISEGMILITIFKNLSSSPIYIDFNNACLQSRAYKEVYPLSSISEKYLTVFNIKEDCMQNHTVYSFYIASR